MSWRDWFGYPGMLDDEIEKAKVDAFKALAKNLTTLAEATTSLHRQTMMLSTRIEVLEKKVELLKFKVTTPGPCRGLNLWP